MKVCPECHLCYDDHEQTCAEDSHPSLLPVRPGERLIAEKYRLDRLIGRGGIGAVYEALQVGLDRAVAVKLLREDYLEDAQALERFRREGRAVARIRHPNVADIYDSGILPSGEAYIVMELVSGETLRGLLDRSGALPIAQAARIGRQLAEGIEAAHRSGVIHRDLKPSNVILTSDHNGAPQAKILDFSIAKLDDASGTASEALTTAGAFLGTPHYMSPEQCEGNPLDARSDLYALGVLLYEMLGGRPPFEGRNPAAVALRQVKESPAPLQRIRADVPEGLAWLVMQALHKKPSFRPESAAEMARRLTPFEADEVVAPAAPAAVVSVPPEPPPVSLPPIPPEAVPEPAVPPPADPEPTGATYWKSFPTEARGGRSSPPRAFPVYAGLAAAILIAGALAWLVIRAPGRPRPDSERTARQVLRVPDPSPRPVSTAAPETSPRPVSVEPVPIPTAAPPLVPAAEPATASSPAPSPRRGDPEPDLRRALDGWIASTNAGDVSRHMRYYMPTVGRFYRTRNVSRSFVRAEKDRLFRRATRIDVRAGVPEIRTEGDGRTATMRFRKRYVIEGPRVSRRGEVEQELRWVRTADGWRIVGERDARVIR